MTISNTDYSSRVYEIAFEGVDGTFEGKFLQGANWPDTDPTVGGVTRTMAIVYEDAAFTVASPQVGGSASAVGRAPFTELVIEPALKRIRAAHGEAPIRLIATRVYVTPATYSTSP